MKSLFLFALVHMVAAQIADLVQSGMNEAMGEAKTGVFGAGPMTSQPKMDTSGGMGAMLGAMLKDLPKMMEKDNTGGSGLYKAAYSLIPGLDNHTVYAPKVIPENVKLPVIVWGNGGCSGDSTGFSKFLTEVASHGYYIVVNGKPGAGMGSSTKGTDLVDAINWIYANAGKGALATVDKSQLAAAGQSCGGIQAYSASLDPRVTLTGIFNSGLISQGNTKLFEKLHAPIGYFLGGSTDIAYLNVSILSIPSQFCKLGMLTPLELRASMTTRICPPRFPW
jgi:hypothetical protein